MNLMVHSEFLNQAANAVSTSLLVAAAILLTCVAVVMLQTYGPLLWATLSVWSRGGKPLPPGTMGLPYWGESNEYVKTHSDSNNPDAWFDAKRKKYGNIFKTHILGKPTVVVLGAEGNKFVLQNNNSLFENSWPPSVRKILGLNCIAVASGAQHTRLRAAVAHFIGPEPLRRLVGTLEELCVAHLDKYWEGKDELKVYDDMTVFSMRVAADVFVRFDTEFMRETFRNLFPFINEGLISFPLNLPWTSFGRGYKASKAALKLLYAEIHRRRKMIASGEKKLSAANAADAQDLMDFQLVWEGEDGSGRTTDQEIAENTINMLMAGLDTTSVTLTTIVRELATHPDVFARLRQECKKVAESKEKGESLTISELKNMSYMRNVIDEGIRITPPVPGGFKKATCNVEYQGFTIPKGWTVAFSMRSTMTKEEYFENPKEFNPDRFSKIRHDTYAYKPFGQGSRMCPGMELAKLEIQLLLYHLVLRYNLELVNPDEQYTMYWFPLPREGLPVRITPVDK